jgi:hypothetical protein
MNEAVAALRQEVARGYERTELLTKDNERLRTLVSSLQRELAKTRGENQTLKSHIRALEKRLHEIHTEPPDAEEQAAAPPPPPPQGTRRGGSPQAPPVLAAPPAPDNAGGDFVEPTPGG